jgi:hypothetical protein
LLFNYIFEDLVYDAFVEGVGVVFVEEVEDLSVFLRGKGFLR